MLIGYDDYQKQPSILILNPFSQKLLRLALIVAGRVALLPVPAVGQPHAHSSADLITQRDLGVPHQKNGQVVIDVVTVLLPNHQRWYAKIEAQLEYVLIAYTLLHIWHRLVRSVGAY